MKLYEFLTLDEQPQFDAIGKHGVYRDSIICNKINYPLYSTDNFYAEVHYNALTNKIIGKLALKQGQHLDKYL